MAYLQVELEAIDKWPLVATGCGIPEEKVYKGFLKLWLAVWRTKNGYVSLLELECFFDMPGRGERCSEILKAFGFLEKRDLGWWVCGAEKYLRITEARSKGGKKASGNLKRGKSPGSSRKAAGGGAGEQPEVVPGSLPAQSRLLQPITQPPIQPDTKNTAPKKQAPSRELSDRLVASYLEIRGEPYLFDSAKDGPALPALLPFGADEVDKRWRAGLQGSGWHSCSSIAQLRQKWKDLHPDAIARASAVPKRAGNARYVNAQDIDKTKYGEPGVQKNGF